MRLFVTNEPVLRAYARTLLPNWETVDDALQEASVTMWEKRGQLNDEDGFLPWAKVILRFKCLSALASVRRRHQVLSDEMLHMLADQADALDAETTIEIRRALRSCLRRFPQAHQELLLAPYAGDGRVKKIAHACGKSADAMYKLLQRLRMQLGNCVDGQLQQEATR